MNTRNWFAMLAGAFLVLMVAVGSAGAADEWFILGEQTLRSSDPTAEIKSDGSRWKKDVKQVKLSVEGADVEIGKVILKWDNRKDETIANLGVLKSGGQSAPKDAPGRKGRLTAVAIQYKILGDAPAANIKVWGFD